MSRHRPAQRRPPAGYAEPEPGTEPEPFPGLPPGRRQAHPGRAGQRTGNAAACPDRLRPAVRPADLPAAAGPPSASTRTNSGRCRCPRRSGSSGGTKNPGGPAAPRPCRFWAADSRDGLRRGAQSNPRTAFPARTWPAGRQCVTWGNPGDCQPYSVFAYLCTAVRPANAWICRRQSGPLEPALSLAGSATTHPGRYTTPRPSGKLHPQAVGGAAGRYGRSPEGQTVTRVVPPIWTAICSSAWPSQSCPKDRYAPVLGWNVTRGGTRVAGGGGSRFERVACVLMH